MIKYTQIQETFKTLNINIYKFKADVLDGIEVTPFAVYAVVDTKSFQADNVVYMKFLKIQFEVVTDYYDTTMISSVEKILTDNDIPYSLELEFDDELRIFSNIFTFMVIDG